MSARAPGGHLSEDPEDGGRDQETGWPAPHAGPKPAGGEDEQHEEKVEKQGLVELVADQEDGRAEVGLSGVEAARPLGQHQLATDQKAER